MSKFEKAAEEFAIEQSELRDKNGPTGNYDNRTWPNEQLDQFMMRHGFIAGARWARDWCFMNGHNPEVCKEIDDILTKLRTENQRLREALESFVEHFHPDDFETDDVAFDLIYKAKQALETGGDEPQPTNTDKEEEK